ncbi:hypothetical protein [Streptomyces griseus]|uniref:hypothetical protein n=1 Tax=Streptomyces griseus TaxID=1911 RepID=UPI0036AA031F
MTAPLLRVRLLLPEAAVTTQFAAQAACNIRDADTTALQEARERAIRAADDLTTAAGTTLAM